jgi:hypothetical protein
MQHLKSTYRHPLFVAWVFLHLILLLVGGNLPFNGKEELVNRSFYPVYAAPQRIYSSDDLIYRMETGRERSHLNPTVIDIEDYDLTEFIFYSFLPLLAVYSVRYYKTKKDM